MPTDKKYIKVHVTDTLYEAISKAAGGPYKRAEYLRDLAEKDLRDQGFVFESVPALGDINYLPNRRRGMLLTINSDMVIEEVTAPPKRYNQRIDYSEYDATVYLRGQDWNEDLIDEADKAVKKYIAEKEVLY